MCHLEDIRAKIQAVPDIDSALRGVLNRSEPLQDQDVPVFWLALLLYGPDPFLYNVLADYDWRHGDYAASCVKLELSYGLDPTNLTTLVNLAATYKDLDMLDSSLRLAKEALEISPDDVPANYLYATTHINLAQKAKVTKSNKLQHYVEAEIGLTRVERQDCEYRDTTFWLGYVLFHQKKYEAAKRYLEKALLLNPGDERPYYLMVVSCRKTFDWKNWLRTIRRAARGGHLWHN